MFSPSTSLGNSWDTGHWRTDDDDHNGPMAAEFTRQHQVVAVGSQPAHHVRTNAAGERRRRRRPASRAGIAHAAGSSGGDSDASDRARVSAAEDCTQEKELHRFDFWAVWQQDAASLVLAGHLGRSIGSVVGAWEPWCAGRGSGDKYSGCSFLDSLRSCTM